MAGHSLLAAYRAGLLGGLPADVAEEVADGLDDAYEKFLSDGRDPDQAAAAAIAEFGDPALVVDAFRRSSPVRRLAKALIITGPVVGACWAAALLVSGTWDWPMAITPRLVVGPLVVALIVLLITALLTRRYRALRWAGTAGCLGVAVLDACVITTALAFAPAGRWLFVVAACLSAARLTFVVRTMRRILAQPGA